MKSVVASLLLLGVSSSLQALDYSGNVAAEAQWFPRAAQDPQQFDSNLTLSFQPKIRQDWNERMDEITLELFLRADNKDDARNHADIRELKWLHVSGDNEWRIGIDSVFWGVTESQHLVDVINQTDRLEGFDGEDKLGQPMVHFTTIKDWGVLHAFVMPGFREAEFRSSDARLRLPLPVDTTQTVYESADGKNNIDVALRYTHFFGDVEYGLSLFDGTNREPILTAGFNAQGQPVLVPYYEQMTQFGLDAQWIVENWLWKLEVIHRDVASDPYNALTGGFEYTFYGVFESAIDVGTLVEYSHDDRKANAAVFDNDVFAGMRLAFNDVQSSEVLAGIIVDVDKQSRSIRVEASRRLGDSWKLTGEVQSFANIDSTDPLAAFARDDYLLLELAYYF